MKRNSVWAAACLAALASATAAAGAKPRIAIVIDDFGLTYPKNVPDEAWMKMPWPMTFAVMPSSPKTREAAAATLRAGKELIIHFPFDPFLSLELPAEQASASDLAKVEALLTRSLADIRGAVGLNNHRSYRATQNRPLMRAFMRLLGRKAEGFYFLDSVVSPRSVAFDEARDSGLPALANHQFLDEAKRHDKEFCMRMLRACAARARRNGQAIAIGHHYFHGTYEGLMEMVPKLQAEGFEFVFASQLLKR